MSDKIHGGYIFLARAIQHSDIWKKSANWLKVWIYVLQEVNHTDNKVFPKGTNFFNYKDISRDCMVSYSTVDNCIRWLKSTGQITGQKTTHGTIITVLNYAKYQTSENYKNGTNNGTANETLAKRKRNTYETINKNDKNVKNEKKEDIAPPEADAEQTQIVAVIEKFHMTELNTTLKYGDKTQRKAAKEMIDQFGMEAIEKIIDFLSSEQVLADPYAPRVTTPYQLQKKWGLIRQYFAKLQGKQMKNKVTVID